MRKSHMGTVVTLALLALALGASAQDNSRPAGYHLDKTVSLPSGGGWDYLGIDAKAQKLYVSAGSQEDVVNAQTLKLEGTISGLKGTHGVAISDRDGHGFTSNGGSNSSTMFDLKTLKVIKEIQLPIERPDGIIYDPASDRIFLFNHAGQAAVLDANSGNVAGTVKLPSSAAEYAAADGRGHVFDNLEDSSQLIEIDSNSLSVTHAWPLAPCEHPSGLAMDTQNHRLFVGCHNNLMAIVNADNGKVVATEPIGSGVDATRFDSGSKLAFSSNGGGQGSITVIREDSPDHYTLVGNLPTAPGARTMELNPKTHMLYTVTASFEAPPASASGQAGQAGGGRGGRGFRRMVPGSFRLLTFVNH